MKSYRSLFDQSLQTTIKTGLKILQQFPQSRASLMHIMSSQQSAARRRSSLEQQGIIVPPLLIVSTTEKCNLHCTGCYARTNCHDNETALTRPQIDDLLAQAVAAGCSVILLAGGEPLLSKDWLEAVAAQPELLGLVFTNGTLLDEDQAAWFAGNRNMIPLFSVEGDAARTDQRRGQGVTELVKRAMQLLNKQAVPFGLSVTTGAHNLNDVANKDFLMPFTRWGCRLVIFTEYVPVDDNTDLLALTAADKQALQDFCHREAAANELLLIAFPGDESAFDGCLAAGRGFVHISSSGALEPCPFAAYSDRNVLDMPFIEALSSPLLLKLRQQSHLLHEGAGGCALRHLS